MRDICVGIRYLGMCRGWAPMHCIHSAKQDPKEREHKLERLAIHEQRTVYEG